MAKISPSFTANIAVTCSANKENPYVTYFIYLQSEERRVSMGSVASTLQNTTQNTKQALHKN